MNPLVIVIPIIVVLGLVVLVASFRRRDRGDAIGELARETRKRDRGEPAVLSEPETSHATGREVEKAAVLERRGGVAVAERGTGQVVAFVPPDPEEVGTTRRQFFNRSIVAFFALGLSGFGAAVIAFLWPQPKGGFGSPIRVGAIPDIKAQIQANNGFLYLAEGRMWITEYPAGAVEKAKATYQDAQLGGMEAGVIALYQKCPHLGCRVPSCPTSQWFECPCHGSQYNQVGEKKGGPAPRGMDGFAMSVSGDVLTVNTGQVIQGQPIGVNTTGQEAEGPHCVGGGGGH
jgi:cytochrome b6-f complex iron-sulfur subunit